MKTYVMITGVLFALIVVAHIMRIFAESRGLATDPFFIGITLLAGALSVWAAMLLRRSRTLPA